MSDERISLETNPEQGLEQQAKHGLKLDNSKSKYGKKPKDDGDFLKKAEEAVGQINDRKARAVEMVKLFWETIKTKTLTVNKGPLQINLEKDMLSQLTIFASEMNNDPNEQLEGTGSIAMITLLFKTAIYQRDRLNDLEYRVDQLEKNKNKASSAQGQ